jgi:hypothetical protein
MKIASKVGMKQHIKILVQFAEGDSVINKA